MVITADSIWHLGKDKSFTPAEFCFNLQALTGFGLTCYSFCNKDKDSDNTHLGKPHRANMYIVL